MDTFRIMNLKSLKDTGEIPLKPITILVGQNSSGKSTFLRTFPLFRQSMEAKTRGPILWYGQYVDFGSFKDAIRRGINEEPQKITFEFKTKLIGEISTPFNSYALRPSYHFPHGGTDIEVRFSISGGEETYIDNIELHILNHIMQISINPKREILSLMINKVEFTSLIKETLYAYAYQRSFFPTKILAYDNNSESESATRPIPIFYKILRDYIKSLLKSPLTNAAINKIILSMTISNEANFLNIVKANRTGFITWGRVIQDWSISTHEFKRLFEYYLFYSLEPILEEVDNQFANTFNQIHYIAPIRATAERYYRNQNLSIGEVDFQGKNLPMFIQAMSYNQKKKFQNWINENFGFIPDIESAMGHLSLVIKKGEEKGYNIADKGFGYSQLLPIITQLWSLIMYDPYEDDTARKRTFKLIKRSYLTYDLLFLIEQPELHLHPALQSKLIDCFISAIKIAKEKGIRLKIIFETHSEAMVNWIGHCIASKTLDNEDVAVVVFNQVEENMSSVKLARYDADGFLDNWPIGFFSPKRF